MKNSFIIFNFKIKVLILIFGSSLSNIYCQTTYTFTNSFDASWSNAPNWSPSYPGETIESGDTVIIDNGAGCHTTGLNIINNGTIIIKSLGFLILDAGSIFEFINNGVIENSGDIVVYNNNILINNGELTNNSIVTGVAIHSINNNIGAIINNNDRFFVNDQLTNDGVFNNNHTGKLFVNDVLVNNNIINNDGVLYGTGLLNPNNNYNSDLLSIIEPSNLNTLNSHGDLDIESTTLKINIDGTNQLNSLFSVIGNAVIEDAKLNIIWTEPPTTNASYTVMTFTSRTGVFSTVNIPPVTGFNFNVSYTNTEVKIEVTQNGLGANDLSIKDNITIWPNPTNDLLNIDLSEYQEEVIIKILDVLGKEVYSKKYINQKTISTNLNINDGIYFVNVIDDKKNKKTYKIIKK